VFVALRPAWCGPDGFPLSWQHYQYGLTHIGRMFLRDQLAMAQAMRMSTVEKQDYGEWQRDMSRLTEVPRSYG
jgi:hypothetical protein